MCDILKWGSEQVPVFWYSVHDGVKKFFLEFCHFWQSDTGMKTRRVKSFFSAVLFYYAAILSFVLFGVGVRSAQSREDFVNVVVVLPLALYFAVAFVERFEEKEQVEEKIRE